MTAPPKYMRNPAVGETRIEEDVFLVDPADQEVFYLDTVTTGLWGLLEQPVSLEEICAVFAEAFPDQDPARLKSDIEAALTDFIARNFVLTVP